MIASTTFLSVMVTVSLAISVAAPILLLYLLYRDWKNGELW
ncbi:MAG: hypothetical protein ACREVE_00720 [Gammaproteobacteria bacterium]